MIIHDQKKEKESEKAVEKTTMEFEPVDPREYCLFDNAVFSRAGELPPFSFLSDLVSPFIGRMVFSHAKGQVKFNNGPNAYSPILDILSWGEVALVGIEFQTEGEFSPQRALAYMANIVVPNIPKGVGLSSSIRTVTQMPKRWILLVFCDFHPFGEDGRAVYRFYGRESATNHRFENGVTYVYVDCKSIHLAKRQREVIHDLKAKRLEGMSIQSFKDALFYARRETNEVEARREKLNMSFREYEQIIMEEGRAEGKAETSKMFVRKLALSGYKPSEIASMLDMPEDEVNKFLSNPA